MSKRQPRLFAPSKYLDAGAVITADGLYRYELHRRLGPGHRRVVFVGLNPSTATGTEDDPTIRREVDFTQRWGFDWYVKANIYAYRSTDPKKLHVVTAPIGPENERWLYDLCAQAELIIAAWGSFKLNDDAKSLAGEVLKCPRTRCLRQTKPGAPPWHPLYLPKTSEPIRWQP